MSVVIRYFIVAACVLLSRTINAAAPEPPAALTVFAAASLADTLQSIGDAYTGATGVPVRMSFAASSALARQIEAGARADIFFSADQDWMDYLAQHGLIDDASRMDLLGNRLALIAPRDSTVSIELDRNVALSEALGARGRLAVADPDSVPAGKYARAALRALGSWTRVEARLARAENVRVALSYVARGETPLGIVYATDAAIEPRVRVVALFPERSHAPITYPVAATAIAHEGAQAYLTFLRGEQARRIFVRAGFEILPPAGQAP